MDQKLTLPVCLDLAELMMLISMEDLVLAKDFQDKVVLGC